MRQKTPDVAMEYGKLSEWRWTGFTRTIDKILLEMFSGRSVKNTKINMSLVNPYRWETRTDGRVRFLDCSSSARVNANIIRNTSSNPCFRRSRSTPSRLSTRLASCKNTRRPH